jgi:hypothetical protein
MYVQTKTELWHALSARRTESSTIRDSRDAWIRREYGIEDFTSIIRKHLGFIDSQPERTFGLLARQLPGICMEDVASTLVSDFLGLEPIAISFLRDVFASKNHDKLHRIKIPWISWSKKGNIVMQYEYAAKFPSQELAGVPLGMIEAKDGRMLSDVHGELRQKVFGKRGFTPDISLMWNEVLFTAKHKPSSVYQIINGREVKVDLHSPFCIEERHSTIRPPSDWYYPIYLSLFLTGEIVLLETYNNPIGGVPEAKILFEKAMQRVTIGTGWKPLIVEIPPLSKEMLYCNRHLLEEQCLERLVFPHASEESSILDLIYKIADLVQKLR